MIHLLVLSALLEHPDRDEPGEALVAPRLGIDIIVPVHKTMDAALIDMEFTRDFHFVEFPIDFDGAERGVAIGVTVNEAQGGSGFIEFKVIHEQLRAETTVSIGSVGAIVEGLGGVDGDSEVHRRALLIDFVDGVIGRGLAGGRGD